MPDQRTHVPLPERFWAKVDKTDSCWLWTASLNVAGYGQFNLAGRPLLAHRLSFAEAHGPMPEGRHLHLHHVCEMPACVNPEHLRLLTVAEHVSLHPHERTPRKTYCIHGHPLVGDNIYIRPDDGKRQCRACRRARDKTRSHRPPRTR